MKRSDGRANLRLLKHRDLVSEPPFQPSGTPVPEVGRSEWESTHVDRPEESGLETGEPTLQPMGLLDTEQESEAALERGRAREAAMRALAAREHSIGELVSKLERKGFDRELAHWAATQLSEEGLQSDDRFAESFVRSRVARGYGPVLIRQELRQREISDDCIDEYLTRDHGFWAGRASDALDKRFREAPDSREAWGRQARYLSRRGFPADLIYACLGDQR